MRWATGTGAAIAVLGLPGLLGLTACSALTAKPAAAPAAAPATAVAAAQPAPPAPSSRALIARGNLAHLARIALPPQTLAVVEARAQGADGQAAGPVLAEWRSRLDGRQVPIAFELEAAPGRVAPGQALVLQAALVPPGGVPWTSAPQPFTAGAAAHEAGTLLLRPAAGPSPEAGAAPSGLRPRHTLSYSSVLECGPRRLRFGPVGEVAMLDDAGTPIPLRPVPTASGARYEAEADPGTWVWTRGDVATVSLRGQALPECTLQALATAPAAFVARGQEPGWQLTLQAGRLEFRSADGSLALAGPAGAAQPDGAARVHSVVQGERRLTARLTDRVCADSMSGLPHPQTVQVALQQDGRTRVFNGCGGAPAALLLGAAWAVERIDGQPVDGGAGPTLQFREGGAGDGAAGSLGGSTGCNAYRARWALNGEGLSLAPGPTSLRACVAEPMMVQERRFLDFLSAVQRFEIGAGGELRLLTADGRVLQARR